MNVLINQFTAKLTVPFRLLGSACVLIIMPFSVAQNTLAQDITEQALFESPGLKDRQKLLLEIDKQFQKIEFAEKNTGTFSIELAEYYFHYASLLSEASNYSAANTAYERALHILKANHGIDSELQMPALEALFNNSYTNDQIDTAQAYLSDIVRIEEKNEHIQDRPSTVMQIKLGHYFLNKLQQTSPSSEKSAEYLHLTNKYFLAAIEQNKHKRLSGSLFPYGELAMATYLGSKIIRKPEKIFARDKVDPTTINLLQELHGTNTTLMESYPAPQEDLEYNDNLNKSFSRAFGVLQHYYKKAYAEGDVEEGLKAVLALGDLNFLNDRKVTAKKYYEVASAVAKMLPENHPDRLALSKPAQLPEFKYALNLVANQEEFDNQEQTSMLVMQLQFDVDERGWINNIEYLMDVEKKIQARARKELRKYAFRPAIVDGSLTGVENFTYAVAVNVD